MASRNSIGSMREELPQATQPALGVGEMQFFPRDAGIGGGAQTGGLQFAPVVFAFFEVFGSFKGMPGSQFFKRSLGLNNLRLKRRGGRSGERFRRP